MTVTNPAPTCSVSFDSNPIAYGGGTYLRWSSANADGVYINSIGYVGTSGATWVSPSSNTNYSCIGYSSAYGNGNWTAATLYVNVPPTPATTITASSASIYVGQSAAIHATFAAGSGDALTADNIDSPVGTGLGATTNPDANKYYTFTPPSAGTYTFYARATTGYYTTWTTYNSVTVSVATAPQCTVSLSPTSIARGASATLSYSSANATTFSINHIGSLTPNTSGSTTVSPSSSTDYTGTASAGGVNATCTAPGTLTVSCTPSYSCSASTIQYTNSSCSVSNVTTCTTPAFCSTGSSSCLYPPPSYNAGTGGLTGHLQVAPSLVPQGSPTTLYWNVANVSSCTVSGTDGESWTGATSGTSGKITTGIQQQTTFTLSCTGLDKSTVHETVTVNIVPVFIER